MAKKSSQHSPIGMVLAVLSMLFLVIVVASSCVEDMVAERKRKEREAEYAEIARKNRLARSDSQRVAPPSPKPASNFDRSRGLTLCDLNMQNMAILKGSFKSSWTPTIQQEGGIAVIRRDFTVKNSYGVDMSGNYECMIAEDTNHIMGIRYTIAGQQTIVDGSDLAQR